MNVVTQRPAVGDSPAGGSRHSQLMRPPAAPHPRTLPSSGVRGLALVACLGLATGCAAQKSLLFQKSIVLPDGRFARPISVDLPRRADHQNRDFEIHAELHAACGPLLRMSFPDGELGSLGDGDAAWQDLLARRAAAGEGGDRPPSGAPRPAGQAGTTRLPPGHWESVRTESWPGQILFLEEREERCAAVQDYQVEYLNALDESGQITFWAETPQEIRGARISILVYEIIEAAAPAKVVIQGQGSIGVDVHVKIPPEPPPRRESPPPAQAEGATWVPGHWEWSAGTSEWVWSGGWWNAPATRPAPRAENTGDPPNKGCTWESGHWSWVAVEGKWDWVPGHWNAPPPIPETPGPKPVPESPWIAGYWVQVSGHFEWVAGHWGKPTPRAETPPAPPYAGATWVSGIWIFLGGSWVWSPGYYERTGHPPPAPRTETPPPTPGHGAVWLSGFWRWSEAKADYEWVGGHWELPPGEGYVWVADPPSAAGLSVGGHWELRVKVKVDGAVKVLP